MPNKPAESKINYGRIARKNIWSYILLLVPNIFVLPFLRRIVLYFGLKNCKNCDFEPGFRFYYGKNIHADNVAFSNTTIMDYAPVTIAEGTAFSKDCKLITAEHDLTRRERIITKPIRIGKNVWIASNTLILSGVRIGDNSVIGAGSVVTHNIPANCLAAGNPAKIIKTLVHN
jgi:maltose O-acetyltransferase